MKATKRSDKSKNKQEHKIAYATFEECKAGKISHALDRHGQIVNVKITSVKTWKTRPEIKVSWKFGLYEYGSEIIRPNEQQRFFVVMIDDIW